MSMDDSKRKGWCAEIDKAVKDYGQDEAEARITAELESGKYGNDQALVVRGWLNSLRMERENAQRKIDLLYIQLTTFATWALAVGTIILALVTQNGISEQKKDNSEQRRIVNAQLVQQQTDSQAQFDNAKALLDVQISVELDKQFDSPEMRKARKILAIQLLGNKKVTESRVIDFFETLGMYMHQRRISEDTIYESYSYYIERYRPALQKYIDDFRQEENGDHIYYDKFMLLYEKMLALDEKNKRKAPDEKAIRRFLRYEATLL